MFAFHFPADVASQFLTITEPSYSYIDRCEKRKHFVSCTRAHADACVRTVLASVMLALVFLLKAKPYTYFFAYRFCFPKADRVTIPSAAPQVLQKLQICLLLRLHVHIPAFGKVLLS